MAVYTKLLNLSKILSDSNILKFLEIISKYVQLRGACTIQDSNILLGIPCCVCNPVPGPLLFGACFLVRNAFQPREGQHKASSTSLACPFGCCFYLHRDSGL